MFVKIRPTPLENERLESGTIEIALHVGSEDAARLARIKPPLDGGGVRALGVNLNPVLAPILQDHGNGRGSAAVLALFDEWHIQPDSRAFLRSPLHGAPQEQRQEQNERGPLSVRDR